MNGGILCIEAPSRPGFGLRQWRPEIWPDKGYEDRTPKEEAGTRGKRLGHEDDGAASGHLAQYSGEFLGGGLRREQRGRHNFKTTPTVTAWPAASSITYGQTLASSTLSGGTASVSGAFSWTTLRRFRRWDAERGRHFYAVGYGGLQHRRGLSHRRREQGDAGGVGLADRERDRLRPDAGFVDSERRHGVGARHLFLDDARDCACYGDGQPGRDLHRYRCD